MSELSYKYKRKYIQERIMIKDVTVFYKEWIKLKDVLRAGWIKCEVPLDRTESVADHVYSCTLLAWSIIEEEKLDLDVEKVMKILLIHEVGEIYIGDITPVDGVSRAEKYQKEYEAVKNLSERVHLPYILDLWEEFEEMKTPESKFCKMIDRLECVMQAKSYGDRVGDYTVFDEFYQHAYEEIKDYVKYLA